MSRTQVTITLILPICEKPFNVVIALGDKIIKLHHFSKEWSYCFSVHFLNRGDYFEILDHH